MKNYIEIAESLTLGMINGSMSLNDMQNNAQGMHQAYDDFTQRLVNFRDQANQDFSERLENAKKESQLSLTTGMVIALVIIISICVASLLIATSITSNLFKIIKYRKRGRFSKFCSND